MDVYDAVWRNVQNRFGNDLPVAHHYHRIWSHRAQLFDDFRLAHSFRLVDCKSQPQSRCLHGRHGILLSAPLGPVGLSEYG